MLGEEILKDYSKTLPDDVIAHPDCIALEATVDELSNILKIDYNNLKPLHILNRISKLKKLYLFKNLSEKTLELIASKLKKRKFFLPENSALWGVFRHKKTGPIKKPSFSKTATVYLAVSSNSTRRLAARPLAVLLVATKLVAPKPL